MSFNPTIDIGDVLKFVAMLASALWFISRMSGRLDLVTAEIKALKDVVSVQAEQLSKFADAIVQIARQDERLNAMDRTLEDLRRGRGFIQHDIDGEWPRKKS